MLEPCDSPLDPRCVHFENPEQWPLIGGVVTYLTDTIGMFFPDGAQNGWIGFGALVVILVGGGYILTKTKEGKTVVSKMKRIVKY